jgi:Trypsin-like peptidase domain
MSGLLQQGIVRVRAAAGGAISGTGFIVSRCHVITCAHVINESLHRAWNSSERPKSNEVVAIDLPFFRNSRADFLAQVVEWFPTIEGPVSDIAVLELQGEVAVQPLGLARDPPRSNHLPAADSKDQQDNGHCQPIGSSTSLRSYNA